MKKFLGSTALALALGASTAMAGVYVSGPLPSEFGGGFVSSDADVFKSELKAGLTESLLTKDVAKCYSKGASNVSKGLPSGVDSCLNDPAKGALAKYAGKIAKISPLPACADYITQGGIIATLVKGFNPSVFCQSPSGAFLDEVSF